MRENLILYNKVHKPALVLRSPTKTMYKATYASEYKNVQQDFHFQMQSLARIFLVKNGNWDFPVSFASTSMYLMARASISCPDTFRDILIPILTEKSDYLHAEGVAHAVWALSQAEVWDAAVWEILNKLALEKDFSWKTVKNPRWSVTLYAEHNNKEHFLQGELTEFASELFYQEKTALFELHQGYKRAAEKCPERGFAKIVGELEAKYPALKRNADLFAQIHENAEILDYKTNAKVSMV